MGLDGEELVLFFSPKKVGENHDDDDGGFQLDFYVFRLALMGFGFHYGSMGFPNIQSVGLTHIRKCSLTFAGIWNAAKSRFCMQNKSGSKFDAELSQHTSYHIMEVSYNVVPPNRPAIRPEKSVETHGDSGISLFQNPANHSNFCGNLT